MKGKASRCGGRHVWLLILLFKTNKAKEQSQGKQGMAEALDSLFFDDEEEKNCFHNLVKDLQPINYSTPTADDRLRPWVFWKDPTPPPMPCDFDIPYPNLAARIRDALQSSKLRRWFADTMVQFWAPIWVGGECFLETSDQPFALTGMHEQLCWFRKECVGFRVRVDGEEGGVLGRVLRGGRLESAPNVNCYSDADYPLCQLALNCDVVSHLAVPVLESSTQNCVGVLEFLNRPYHDSVCFDGIGGSLEGLDLIIGLPSDCKFAAAEHPEMREMLEKMKEIRKVCLAQAWVACRDCCVEYQPGTLEKGCACFDSLCLAASFDVLGGTDGPLNEFSEGCHMHRLQKGQGLVGKAYLSPRPYFCRDISQFTSNEYPLVYYARHARLARSFAICLHHTCSDNYYILELFFNPGGCEDPLYILGSITKILQKFTSLKVAFGEESLRVEVIQPSTQMCQTTLRTSGNGGDNSLPSSASHQLAMVVMEDASSGSDVVVVAVNDSKKSNTVPFYPQDARSTEVSISYETLEQHFGRKLEDAAARLGVSRSTLKRISRRHGIPRWPWHKRSRANSKRDAPLPHLLPDKPAATVDTAMYCANTITVKAKYRDDFLKFELPFSSGMVDLKEQLSKRLESRTAAYKILYLDEDGDPVLITCDEDLWKYMSTCISQGGVLRDLAHLLCIISHQLTPGRPSFFLN